MQIRELAQNVIKKGTRKVWKIERKNYTPNKQINTTFYIWKDREMQIERTHSKFSKINKKWPMSDSATRDLRKLRVTTPKCLQKNQIFSSENINTRSWITLKHCFQNSEGEWSVFHNSIPSKKQQSNVRWDLK